MDVLVDLTPLDTTSRTSGTGRYINELGRALLQLTDSERQGLSIQGLVDLSGPDAVGPLDYPGGARCHDERGSARYWMRRRLALPMTLRSIAPKLFHATYHLATPRGSGVLRVVTCLDLVPHVLHQDYLNDRPVYRRVLLATDTLRFRSAKRVQAISQHTADDLMRLCQVPSSRIDVVLLGVDLERYRPLESLGKSECDAVLARYNLTRDGYFFYVGASDPRKNVDILVQAFAKAKLDGVELILIGKLRASDQRAYQQAQERAGNPAGVRFLGFVPEEDLPAIMSGALGFPFCSTYEGFGNVPVEAMAVGCPVVHTGLTSMAETMADAGLKVPPRDADAVADAMRQLAQDSSLRAQLSRSGIARAQLFSWRNTALASVDSYRRALT